VPPWAQVRRKVGLLRGPELEDGYPVLEVERIVTSCVAMTMMGDDDYAITETMRVRG